MNELNIFTLYIYIYRKTVVNNFKTQIIASPRNDRVKFFMTVQLVKSLQLKMSKVKSLQQKTNFAAIITLEILVNFYFSRLKGLLFGSCFADLQKKKVIILCREKKYLGEVKIAGRSKFFFFNLI